MISKIKDLVEKDNCYSIGIRKRDDKKGLLCEGNYAPFHVIPISVNNWYADPTVFSKGGRDYLFCEEYDRKKDKGFISVTELTSINPAKPHKVLETSTHLSYPCVFELNGIVYMIPETTTKKTIEMYRAVEFPDRWEYACELMNGAEWADTTIFQDGENMLMLTFEQFEGDGSITKVNVWDASEIAKGKFKQYSCKQQFVFNDHSRGGGKVFAVGEEYYRPAQICTPEYGYALNFMRISLKDGYEEEISETVFPEEIKCDLNKKIIGIHTYALTDQYEIIDVKFDDPKLRYQIRRVYRFLLRKIVRG